jgi:hypothetical protein
MTRSVAAAPVSKQAESLAADVLQLTLDRSQFA